MDEKGFAERIGQDQQARRNACRILEVAENADRRAVQKAYRRACRKTHPDFNPFEEKSHEKFLQVQSAYEFLMKGTTDKMLVEKLKAVSIAPSTEKYDLENEWGYFLWWREQFFDGF